MSWNDLDRENSYYFYMVDSNGAMLGQLRGFVEGSGYVTYDYYTEIRRIASIQTVNDNYIENSMIKIVVKTNKGDEQNLGAYVVADIEEEEGLDGTIKQYELKSIEYKLKTSLTDCKYHYQGLTQVWLVVTASIWDRMFGFNASSDIVKMYHNYGDDGYVVEAGVPRLDVLNNLCSDCNLRYNPRDTYIDIEKYVRPSTKPASYTFSLTNKTISTSIKVDGSDIQATNKFIIKYNGNNNNIIGVANAPSSSPAYAQKRKQYICESEDLSSMWPETQERANQIAKERLNRSWPTKSYSFTGIYAGLREGDCINLVINEVVHKCMVKEMKVTLDSAMSVDYTVKEVSQYD